jgi:S1-C subfamily serine protease
MDFVDATLLGRDLGRDLAILRIATDTLAPVALRTRPSRIGNLALALGRPYPPAFQATFGSIQSIGSLQSRRSTSDLLIRTNVMMLPGFSGGPLIDLTGEVIGINTSGLLWKGGVTIPSEHVSRIASDISKFGHVRVGWIGVSVQQADLSTALISQLDDQDVALLVTGIADGSPALTSELMVGDMLISLGGHSLSDPTDLQMMLSGDQIDQEVEFTVLRGGAITKIQVTPGERPGCASK